MNLKVKEITSGIARAFRLFVGIEVQTSTTLEGVLIADSQRTNSRIVEEIRVYSIRASPPVP
jgi:hypothetical protein